MPQWLPWARRRLALTAATEREVGAISARQIDRVLAPHKRTIRRQLYGRTTPGTLLKHHIPVKTDHWDVTEPGFTEVDWVSHSGVAKATSQRASARYPLRTRRRVARAERAQRAFAARSLPTVVHSPLSTDVKSLRSRASSGTSDDSRLYRFMWVSVVDAGRFARDISRASA